MNKTITENILKGYRALGSNLEAARQVRLEAEEAGKMHWHRIHERCWCGYLTVPAACYTYDKDGRQTNTQEDAEKKYLAALSSQERTEIASRTDIRTDNKRTAGRPKKWASEAERLKAYRERSITK